MDEGTRMRSGKPKRGHLRWSDIHEEYESLEAYSNELCAKVNASDALRGTVYLFPVDLVLQER